MKTKKLSNGYVSLTPAKNKTLCHQPSGKYFSEAVVKEEKAGEFIETTKNN